MRSQDKLSNKQFKELVEKKIRKTISKHRLFTKRDLIGVAVSGGKDSMVCLYVLNKLGYNTHAVSIDPGIGEYSKANIKNIKDFCKSIGVKLEVYSFKDEFGKSLSGIQKILKSKGIDKAYCMVCGVLKRYLLNKYARKLGFKYVATGHNLDDEAQSFVMNVFRNDFRLALRQGPKPGLINSEKFVVRVKPLYAVTEKETEKYSKISKFPVKYGMCPYSNSSFRRQFLNMLDDFEAKHPSVKYNILKFQETLLLNAKKICYEDVKVCRCCAEPSAGDICKTCALIKEFENASVRKN